MCDCSVCQDSRRFQSELDKVPAEQQPILKLLYDVLLDYSEDLAYSGAILDGSWPDGEAALEYYQKKPGTLITAPTQQATEVVELLEELPSESQPYFRSLAQRVLDTGLERARVKNIVRHAVPDAAEQIAQYRKALPASAAATA
jgi:hypothetical protein